MDGKVSELHKHLPRTWLFILHPPRWQNDQNASPVFLSITPESRSRRILVRTAILTFCSVSVWTCTAFMALPGQETHRAIARVTLRQTDANTHLRQQTEKTDLLINSGRVHYSPGGASNHQSIESPTGHFLFSVFRRISPFCQSRHGSQICQAKINWMEMATTQRHASQLKHYAMIIVAASSAFLLSCPSVQRWIFESWTTAPLQFFKREVVLFFFRWL